MASSSEDEENRKSLIEEALKILNEEGFRLPGDVIDTLQTVSRASARPRGRGSLRGHRMCEVQSSNRKMRNVRESSAKRSQDRDAGGERRSGAAHDRQFSDSDNEPEKVETEKPKAETVRAELSNSRDVTSYASSKDMTDRINEVKSEGACYKADEADDEADKEESECSSVSSASTVRKVNPVTDSRRFQRQDSGSSAASSGSGLNRKSLSLDGRRGSASDTGYSTSIENALQTHEARAENLKNINKHTENLMSQRFNNGLKREISHDSGFTETGYQPGSSQCSTPVPSDVNKTSTQEFHDISKTKTDVSEKYMSTPAGDAHVVTSCTSDLAAAEMMSRSNDLTDDGTAVSTASKLSHQETGSENARATTKTTDQQVSKEEDYEVENRTTNSSRNDSISTSIDDITTASSRHAASMEQNLHLEKSRLVTSTDGNAVEASMAVDEQLCRQQEVNNVERCSDGSSKDENKQVSEKSSISKSHKEHKMIGDNCESSLSSSQHLEGRARQTKTDERSVGADGSETTKHSDNANSSFAEENTTEQRKVVKDITGDNACEEVVKKSDKSSNVESSFSVNEVKVSPSGERLEMSKSEDSKALSSSFSGQCESTEVKDGLKLHRTVSSEKSSENTSKSSKSFSTFSSSSPAPKAVDEGFVHTERRPSTDSQASTLTNFSGLSRENIRPPSYEETMSNISRRSSCDQSPLYSRQDSCASSIASSAGAENERQRQKELARTRNSFDNVPMPDIQRIPESNYRTKVPDYLRQASNTSDTTISEDNDNRRSYTKADYEPYVETSELSSSRGRVIDHPIRQTGQSAYCRSLTDSVCDRPKVRRTTLDDVVLTERELRQAREEVRSQVRGMDDTYVSRPRAAERSSRRPGAFGSVFDRSFEEEVFDMVDRFFKNDDDDDDDDFGFSDLRSSRRRSKNRASELTGRQKSYATERHHSYDTPLTRVSRNPYIAREDLSRLSREEVLDSLTSNRARATNYAASDYGSNIKDRNSHMHVDLSDSVSDSGYIRNRFANGRDTSSSNAPPTQPQYYTADRNHYRFSDSSPRLANSTGDKSHRVAEKSIDSSRDEIGASISTSNRRSEQNKHTSNSADYSRTGFSNESNNDAGRYNGRKTYSGSQTDLDAMSDVNSTCYSMYSLPPEVLREGRENGDTRLQDGKSQSLPDVSRACGDAEQNGDISGDERNRKKRIDKALTWIRAELTGLRTQDKVLMSQFQRCQESIEQLKKQRPWYEVFSDEEEGDEEEEEERHWEDWEIEDFDRSDMRSGSDRNLDRPGATIIKDYRHHSSSSSSKI